MTDEVPFEMLRGPVVWVRRSELGVTLRRLGCSNLRLARREFRRYGVTKFWRYTQYRGAVSCDPFEVRLVDEADTPV